MTIFLQLIRDYLQWLVHLDDHLAAWLERWVATWKANHTRQGIEEDVVRARADHDNEPS